MLLALIQGPRHFLDVRSPRVRVRLRVRVRFGLRVRVRVRVRVGVRVRVRSVFLETSQG